MSGRVVPLTAIDVADPWVGGKGAGLAALARLGGIRVPEAFVVTAEGSPDPQALSAAVAALGAGPFAVRSSATTEDGAAGSSAGLHDSFLRVPAAEVPDAARRVRESVASGRAAADHRRRSLDPSGVRMAVVVQRMVEARAAGTLFTAHPVSGHRRVAVIEAVPGLGEALVAGRVTPERLEIRDGAPIARSSAGPEPVLGDAEALALVALGRRIEAALGGPVDLEWCLDGDGFAFVQARPITALFPIPPVADGREHVFLSVGHQQMMTDPMTPLGLSLFQRVALRPMTAAGGRLFVDITDVLDTPGRDRLLQMMANADPRTRDALLVLLERRGLTPADPGPAPGPPPLDPDPALVPALIARGRASVDEARRRLDGLRGLEALDAVLADIPALKQALSEPDSVRATLTSFAAVAWLDENLSRWLGEEGLAAVLARSVPHSVTAEMGLALLDVADVLRQSPAVPTFLEGAGDDALDRLRGLPGGDAAADAVLGFLDRYGSRCVGEIDVARPRWRERPAALLPTLLSHVRGFPPGEGARRFARGAAEAATAADGVLRRLRALPDGDAKAAEAEAWIARLRAFAGYREFPKFGMIERFALYRRALLAAAEDLVRSGALPTPQDAAWLTLDELREAIRSGRVDALLLRERSAAFHAYARLAPPRVLTSNGERLEGREREAPPGALVGLGVSAGIAEGRARVVSELGAAGLEPGDILVTRFTDPGWTPAFVAIAGLVTEVGGRTTHGAVIAREYGLPAVVSVTDATTRIRDGQRIRVDGTAGLVELLDPARP